MSFLNVLTEVYVMIKKFKCEKIALFEFLNKSCVVIHIKYVAFKNICKFTSLAFHHCPTELPEKLPMS